MMLDPKDTERLHGLIAVLLFAAFFLGYIFGSMVTRWVFS